MVIKRKIGRYRTKKRVRQGCLLSAVLFNILFEDRQEVMTKRKIGEWFIGKKKIWTIAYANDVALVVNNERRMKKMMKAYRMF